MLAVFYDAKSTRRHWWTRNHEKPAFIPGRYECGNSGVFRLVQTNPILHSLTRQRIGLSKMPNGLLGG